MIWFIVGFLTGVVGTLLLGKYYSERNGKE